MLLLITVLCVAPAVLIGIYFTGLFMHYCWIFRKFRGPFALPLIGNCYTSEALVFLRYLSQQRKRFGKIFVFFGFWKARLIVCDPVVVRRILSDSKVFPKGTDYTVSFSYVFGQGLVTSIGDKHKKDRAIFSKYFIKSNIVRWTKVINEIVGHAVGELLLTIPADGKPVPTNMEEVFAKVALRVFMMFCTGSDYRKDPEREHRICHSVSAASHAVGRIIGFGIPLWSFMPEIQKLDKLKREVQLAFLDEVRTRKELLARGEMADTDDCLTAMFRENMNEKDMFDHFMTLISAGHDTSAYFSSYFVFLLAKHPDVQDKLRKEITDHLQGREEVTADDISEMSYLGKVMQETMRFYAIIPSVSRTSTEEVHIKEANVTIPKGIDILIPMSIINRDPTIWENPSEFNPERFEGKVVDFTSAKNGFFPFGYGPRTCIGNTLAQVESGIIMCKLLRRCRFEVDPGFKLKILAGISLTTKGGINVIVRPL